MSLLTYEERESKIEWIASEFQILPIECGLYLIKSPNLIQRQYGSYLYKKNMEECRDQNVLTKDEMRDFMMTNGFWTEKDIKMREDLLKNLDNFKVELFNNYHKQGAVPRIKEYIKITRDKLSELFYKEVKFDSFTAEYISTSSKTCYLIASNLFEADSNLFLAVTRTENPDYLVDAVISYVGGFKPGESELREIARTDPWRSIWAASEKMPLTSPHSQFSVGSSANAIDMSMEFRSLITWSKFYDNVHQSSEPPRECIIEDDDALDGWCLLNRRKREGDDNRKLVDKAITNPRIKNSQEILVRADSWDEVKMIDEFNDATGKMVKKQRMNAIKQAGEINELDMPDTRQRLEQAIVQSGRNAIHGGGRKR